MSAIEDIGVRLDNVEFKEISESDNRLLIEPFEEKEIEEAIWNCDSHKSPGPNGVTFSFIKKYWCLLENDVLGAVKFFHNEGIISKGCNASFLTLIPKSENPQSLEEYRPISLVGCQYKILTKVLSNRIKKVIEKVIDGSQSAFLSNRGLLDSVLVVNEVVDDLKRRKKRGVIVKLDFEKAYDSRKFLWGWGTEGRKIAWISWDNICKEKEVGGLGIRRIEHFNKALLAKWLWRLGSTKYGLWKEVLESRVRYERIYNNSELKDKTIDNYGIWNAVGWEWKFSWRRDWFEWEKTMVEEFMSIISQVLLQPDKEDSRLWNDPPSYTFSVKSAYNKLANHGCGGISVFGSLWNLKVMPSAMFFVWRAFSNRLATKQNLHKRGVILGATLCALCGTEEESTAHILLSCKESSKVWNMCFSWLGISSANHKELIFHFEQFSCMCSNKEGNKLWKSLWVSSMEHLEA
ncbi:uncharacterized protein [Phaseolus vulgaris]|uniref:uncharacterized protein n=1 Tax=Phaseolus vulgaris TaxID=3885 RepID=UPI0035C9BB86